MQFVCTFTDLDEYDIADDGKDYRIQLTRLGIYLVKSITTPSQLNNNSIKT
jgi:hypothetical protein